MAGPAISGRLALPGVPGAALEGTAHGVLGAMPGEALGGRQWPRIQGDGTVARIRSPTAKTRRRFGRYARRLRRSAQEGTHENRPHLPFHRARGMRDIRSAKVPVAMRLRTALDRLARRLLSPPPRRSHGSPPCACRRVAGKSVLRSRRHYLERYPLDVRQCSSARLICGSIRRLSRRPDLT